MQIARVFGTPVRIDPSWLLIFALLVLTLSARWSVETAALTVVALFGCVIAHELAHVLVARAYGIGTHDIVLFAFGGVSRMEEIATTARAEGQIALAGPMASLGIALIAAASAPLFEAGSTPYEMLNYLAVLNSALAVFNVLPAYPVDGGRIIHSIVWRITGERLRATKIAVLFSKSTGLLMALTGVALLLAGNIVDGVWLELLAIFIIRAASAEFVADSRLFSSPRARRADLVDPPSGSFQPDITCAQARSRMIKSGRRAVPVAVSTRLLGILTLDDFTKLGTHDPNSVYVSRIMTPSSR